MPGAKKKKDQALQEYLEEHTDHYSVTKYELYMLDICSVAAVIGGSWTITDKEIISWMLGQDNKGYWNR